MSIAWMTRVWNSPLPAHPTERLLLLALADSANEAGVSWPKVNVLRRKCGLGTLRGTRKVIERLERGRFIARISRPGRSTVYQLNAESLLDAGPEEDEKPDPDPVRRDRGAPERADRAGAVPRDRGPGPPGPPTPELTDRGVRSARTARTQRETKDEPKTTINNTARRSREPPDRGRDGPGDVVDEDEDLVRLLTERGLHEPVAQRLVDRFALERVRQQIDHFDQRCEHDQTPHSPGWLVRAIEEDYPPPQAPAIVSKLFTHPEMLRWCERNGGLKLTAEFEPVKQGDQTLFRWKGRADSDPSSRRNPDSGG